MRQSSGKEDTTLVPGLGKASLPPFPVFVLLWATTVFQLSDWIARRYQHWQRCTKRDRMTP